MNISEIRVKLVPNEAERLKAFCSITLDEDFVVRDLKVIDGANGLFVAMPSRKLCDRCPKCGCKNHLRARHCNECGGSLSEARASRDEQGRAKLHADIAHPINAACREKLQAAVVEAFRMEIEKSRQPGYQPPSLDEEDETAAETEAAGTPPEPAPPKDQMEAEEDEGGIDDYASLIAGLKQDAKSRRRQRPGRDRESTPPETREEAVPAAAQSSDEPVGGDAGTDVDPLDSFLSKLGTSEDTGKSSRRRRSGRHGSGSRRRDQDSPSQPPAAPREPQRPREPVAEPEPVSTAPPREQRRPAEPRRPTEPVPEPEPVSVAPPQAPEPEEPDDDDFGAGIL